MPTRRSFKEHVTVRRLEAQVRESERTARGDAGQLSRLEQQGFGECREAKRLRQKLGKS